MPCQRIGNMIACGPKAYEWEGWVFEVHSYFGPWPLRKTDRSTPLVRASNAFWAMWKRWEQLPNEEQEQYRI